jgi:hypothetical protein
VIEQLTCDLTLPNAGVILLEFQFQQHCDSKLWNEPWMIPHFRIASAEIRHQHPDSKESTTFARRNAHAPPLPVRDKSRVPELHFAYILLGLLTIFFVLEHLHPDLKAAFV